MMFKEIVADLRRPWTGGEQDAQENAGEMAGFLEEFAVSEAEMAVQLTAQAIADGQSPVVVADETFFDADEALEALYGVLFGLAQD